MTDESIPLDKFGYAPGYFIYPDGRVWSNRSRKRGGAFKRIDRTGCTLLMQSDGSYSRRSTKVLAFKAFLKPKLDKAGYSTALQGKVLVSPNGVARNVETGEILAEMDVKGYKCVSVEGKSYLLHRVVADAFIPNPNNLPEIDHIDGDKSNNCVENLRWVTRSENMKYAFESGAITDSLRKARDASIESKRKRVLERKAKQNTPMR